MDFIFAYKMFFRLGVYYTELSLYPDLIKRASGIKSNYPRHIKHSNLSNYYQDEGKVHNMKERSVWELSTHMKINMNASVAIQVLPKCDNDEELIRIVDEVIDYIKGTGLSYYVGPCETSIEGEYDELMDIIKECQNVAVRAGATEVSAYVKISYKPEGEVLTIDRKVTKHHK